MNGILALWKEKGMTSHDCVFKLRKILKTKKVGHTGTLDPQVDGVLPICIGSATKMVEFMMNSDKEYYGEVTLGFSTTTEDATGDVVASAHIETVPSADEIDAMMESMTGTITQVPPMYSAVKVNGKKLYEYARANQTVERPERIVTIHQFKRVSDVVAHENGTVSWQFVVRCSKGTYVRTLAVDLGEKLGFPAHMSQLTRTLSAGFQKEHTVTLQALECMTDSQKASILKPIEEAFVDYPRVTIDDTLWEKIKNGAVVEAFTPHDKVFVVYDTKIVALYEQHPYKKGMMKPKKMLLGNVK
ncbi:tRNA pseudouridine(55) synthase TruB [Carnobacteriaceae bacterium zg-ZUI240]|nr:tRNA pseudouridine(55) synthase TruB [Carnobacteriaceae bacterium zg-ZUI240]